MDFDSAYAIWSLYIGTYMCKIMQIISVFGGWWGVDYSILWLSFIRKK
jgi:hypothetical protein